MTPPPSCPRCRSPVRPPGLWSSEWQCERCGPVPPFRVLPAPGERVFAHVAARSAVPVWVPHPLPHGWLVTGMGHAGDERTGARATVVALGGPSPLGGPADLLVVAEEPGVGLGARYAGIPGPDPGPRLDGAPEGRLEAAGHPTALWSVPGAPDRTALVGEAEGVWLWLVAWPETADLILLEHLSLRDLRSAPLPLVPFGAPSPRLTAA